MNISTVVTKEEYTRLQELAWHFSRIERKRVSQSEVIRRALDMLFARELLEVKGDKLPLDNLVIK